MTTRRLIPWQVAITALIAALLMTPVAPAAQAQGMIRVSFAQAQNLLSFAPVYVARAKFFKDAGINGEFDIVAGGGPVAAALSGGSDNFGLTASTDLVNFASKGEDFEAVVGLCYQTIEVVVNKEWARRKGVNKASTLKARIQALKGAVIGSTSPGAISETLAQYLLRWAGMDPARDVEIVPMGDLGPRLAAMQSNRIQVILSSPPAGQEAEKGGFGITLIPAKDLPGFNRQVHEVVLARKSWLARNKDLARRVATAIARGNNFFLDNFDESVRVHETFFPHAGRDVLVPGLRSVHAQTLRNGWMAPQDWVRTMELLKAIGAVHGALDVKEGAFWTDEYIDLSRLK